MVMNNNPPNDEKWEGFDLFPERDDVVLPDEPSQADNKGSGGYGSATQNMVRSPKLSDVQTIDKRLFPDLGKTFLNNLMIAGIFPDLYNDLFDIIVKGLLLENSEMTLEEAVCTAEVALSVGIDREGRIDAIAILGSPQVASENEKKLIGNF
ncbi:MAG: hypothetical protein WC364_15430 [Eubacteriales bacterium]|jgi:hypothetical protein